MKLSPDKRTCYGKAEHTHINAVAVANRLFDSPLSQQTIFPSACPGKLNATVSSRSFQICLRASEYVYECVYVCEKERGLNNTRCLFRIDKRICP